MRFRRLVRIIGTGLLIFSGWLEPLICAEHYWREFSEWGASGLAFYAAHKLDHQPVWVSRPLLTGRTDRPFKDDTVPTNALYGIAARIGAGMILIPNTEGWLNRTTYTHTKGFAESLCGTYLLTVLTKNIVGRRRPSYDHYPKSADIEASKSFFSGHASISFATATYSSLYVIDHIGGDNIAGSILKMVYATGALSLASYIAYTRVADNKHFVSDVIVGGIVGTTFSYFVYSLQERGLPGKDNDSAAPDKVTRRIVLVLTIPL